ncbi:IQ motif and SEC7 domain-containing protein 2-like isoform X2 [Sycon ciliatum]|uniref:IQ motif and SEC7 domain-containing protein 2-like isoform X2 n=1 Tax=Sycon ciliatum TaxID=27933 RepID=UPI0020AB447F
MGAVAPCVPMPSRTVCKAPVSAPQWPDAYRPASSQSIGLSSDVLRTPTASTSGHDTNGGVGNGGYEQRRQSLDDEQDMLTPRSSGHDAAINAFSCSSSSSGGTLGDMAEEGAPRKAGTKRRTSRSFDDHALVQRASPKHVSQKPQPSSATGGNGASARRLLHGSAAPLYAPSVERTLLGLSFELEVRVQEQIIHDICRYFNHNVPRCQRAARTIQKYYRTYCLAKRVHILRSARRSGTFRRSSDTEAATIIPNLKHLQSLHQAAIKTSPPVVPQLITEEDDESLTSEHVTQCFDFDEETLSRETDSPPPGYTADFSSMSSSVSSSVSSSLGYDSPLCPGADAHDPGQYLGVRDAKCRVDAPTTAAPPAYLPPAGLMGSPALPNGTSSNYDLQRRANDPSPLVARPPGSEQTRQNLIEPPPPRDRRNSVYYEVRPPATPTAPGQESGETKARKQRRLRIGITHFNRKPPKGISYLTSKRLLSPEPRDIALFLKRQGGLSRKMVGEYLGTLQNPLCQSVLREFVSSFKFEGFTFVQALRKFLGTFQIPGEAQKIEKILELFADRYASCNSVETSVNPDTCFILAFSTIMLNTDLHNASVKKHMTKDEFIRNNRGIDDGKDLPTDFLSAIYDDISEREFATPKDHVLQVLSLQKSIVGHCPLLALPHRQLVHVVRLYEVLDRDRKQPPNAHSRFLFLFNDMLLVAKYAPKKSLNTTYLYKTCYQLIDIKAEEFSNSYYKFGIALKTVFDEKVVACFNGEKESMTRKFSCDLKEVLLEINEMEQERLLDIDELAQRGGPSKGNMSPDVTRRRVSAPKWQKNGRAGAVAESPDGGKGDVLRARSQTLPPGQKSKSPFSSPSPDSGEGAHEASRGTNIFGSLKGRSKKKKISVQNMPFGNSGS